VTVPEPPDPPAGALTYDPEIGPGYFVQTRADFLRWPHFAPLVKVLYQVLLTYCGAGETAWPGQDRLARECGVSINTIRPALETLQTAGLVSITRRGLNRTNLYHVHKLPLVLAVPTKETQKLRIQTTNIGVSKSAKSAAKVHSVESQTVETGIDPELDPHVRGPLPPERHPRASRRPRCARRDAGPVAGGERGGGVARGRTARARGGVMDELAAGPDLDTRILQTFPVKPRAYSTDAEAAVQLLASARAFGKWRVLIYGGASNSAWKVTLRRADGQYTASADTLALAICRAVLTLHAALHSE
jgi:hypothetical protein